MSNITLPKEPVPTQTQNPKTLVIYGPPKVGKTELSSMLEGNLIIDFEDGSDYVEALKKKVNNFDEVQELGEKIVSEGCPYPYVTIDTITELEEWCEEDATEMYKATPQGKNFEGDSVLELAHGGGYYWLRESFKKWIRKLRKLAPTIIFVAHVKDRMITKKGKDVTAKDLDLTGKIRNITASGADAIGYIYRDPTDSKACRISFVATNEVTSGSRCKHLRGQDFIITRSDDEGNIIEHHWDKIFIDND